MGSPVVRSCTAVVLGAVVALTACTPAGSDRADEPPGPPAQGGASSPSTSSPVASPTASTSRTPSERVPEAASRVSLPGLMAAEYDGRGLRLGRVLARTDAYVRHAVSYRSGDLRISGIMNLPRGSGPFPVLVLLHGYIDPAVYVTGQGLMREQDYLAREGYAVLHVDYRNHAGSDDDPTAEVRMRLGYAEDAINAVLAVRRSGLAHLDGERIGFLGRSMGGGVVYNALVAQPGLVDAAVVFAPVSSRTKDNFNRWIRDDRSELAAQIVAQHGSPEDNPRFWREVSPRPYFDRITEPVLIHHGTSDDSCPVRWTRATYRAMRAAGVDVTLRIYPGEEHAFGPQWPLSMRRTVAFLDRHLRA